MIDRIFSATLTFGLLIAGTIAIGAALFGLDQRSVAARAAATPVRVVQLERVVVTAKRVAAPIARTAAANSVAPRLQ